MQGKTAACFVASAASLLCFALCPSVATAAAPPNDDFANAQQLSDPLPLEVSGTTVGATHQEADPGHSGYLPADHTIWFKWEASSTEDVTIGTCESKTPTILSVYTGSGLDALTEVASNDYSPGPNCASTGSEVTLRTTSGTTYSIEVDGNAFRYGEPPASGEGPIELQIHHQVPPANDDFADAETLAPSSPHVSAGNWGATKEFGEPDHRGKPGGASVWFNWTPSQSGGAFIRACGDTAGVESLVAVYTGSSVDALSSVAPFNSRGNCEFSFMAIGGVTYRIAVDGEYNAVIGTGNMEAPELSISRFPENDNFESAHEIRAGTGAKFLAVGYGNLGASKQPGEPHHAGNSGGASVWFKWTAPESGSLQASACSGEFPPLLAIYTGSSVDHLTPVAASSNARDSGCPGLQEGDEGQVGFNTDAGTTYRIAIDGYEGAWGKFGLVLSVSDERLRVPPQRDGTSNQTRPSTRIARRHVYRRRGIAVFSLRSNQGLRFLCKLDFHRFHPCGSTVIYRHLKSGRHTFRAKAVDAAGLADPTPVSYHFWLPRKH